MTHLALEKIFGQTTPEPAATICLDVSALRSRSTAVRIRAPRRMGVRAGALPRAATPAGIPAIPVDEAAFSTELLLLVPRLRAFSRKLTAADSDDLVQDALLRAWHFRAKYQPGTNFKAWVFTILRNQHFTTLRRSWRNQPMDPDLAENTLVANDSPDASEELLDVRNAMHRLPNDQLEALMVGPAELSYKEAAAIWGCAEGTVKSRVSRARRALTAVLEESASLPRARTGVSSTEVFEEMMQDAARMRNRLAPA